MGGFAPLVADRFAAPAAGDSCFAIYPPEQAPSAHLKQLVKKIGQDKAMEILKGAPL